MQGNQTWDGEQVTEVIDVVLQIRTPEIWIVLVAPVTPVNLIFKNADLMGSFLWLKMLL